MFFFLVCLFILLVFVCFVFNLQTPELKTFDCVKKAFVFNKDFADFKETELLHDSDF